VKPILLTTFVLVTGLSLVQADGGATNDTTSAAGAMTELSATGQSTATNGAGAVTLEKSAPTSVETKTPAGVITQAPPTRAKRLLSLFDPFAPLPPEPKTPWRERTGWAGAADKNGSMTPEAVRHQAQFGVVVAGR
jgi:hypothetical protein